MSLRILFADDSMTAQNMGKKILTDAGYDVIAVSNGAAAVKKIAEHKPDIIILDVYMPGYTGLEVCEKVRASIDTLKTPVLLTVGKLEPYRAEDANRVKADGVIIKPFEASDLIAIVKKLEERVVHKSDPVGEQTILLDRPPDFSQFPARAEAPVAEEPAHHAPEPREHTVQATVDVPDHMAMAAAFGDLLATEPSPVTNSNHAEFHVTAGPQHIEAPSTFSVEPQIEEVPSAFSAEPKVEEKTAAFQVEPQIEHAPIPFPVQPQAESVPTVVDFHSAAKSELKINLVHSSGPVHIEPAEETMIMPAYKEPEHEQPMAAAMEIPVQHDPAFEAPEELEVASPADPALQPSFEEQGKAEIHASADPGLMAGSSALEAFPTRFGMENAEEVPVGVASDLPDSPETAAIYTGNENHASVNEDDFDARVAAALAAYDQAAEMEAAPEPQAVSHEAELPVSFEYVPPVSAPVQEKAMAQVGSQEPVPEGQATAVLPVKHESEPPTAGIAPYVVAETEAVQKETEEAIVSGIETEVPMAAAAGASQSGQDSHHVIADVVHRVMERFKPELIAEIVRELKLNK